MGINHGPAVVGNVGSLGKKIEFTALGDTINTASRLEGINKVYGTRICVPEIVKRNAGGRFAFRTLDTIRMKGKAQPTRIYELVGYVDTITDEERARITDYERGIDLYLLKNFAKAVSIFDRLAREGDMASRVFAERCRDLLEHGITIEWDGVYTATEK